MKKLVIGDDSYERIFLLRKNYLLKYSPVDVKAWELLMKKNLSFVNCPIKVDELDKDDSNRCNVTNCKSKIILPFLTDYKALSFETFTPSISDEEFLKLWKRNVILLRELHDNDIVHGDIYGKNIMINDKLDIQFIDLDAMIIGDMISIEHGLAEEKEDYTWDEFKQVGRYEDKVSLMGMYLYYLCLGKFSSNIVALDNIFRYIHLLGFSEEMELELISYMIEDKEIDDNYYFEDMIDELIRMGYEKSFSKKRKLIH